jgi:hypothetical protein
LLVKNAFCLLEFVHVRLLLLSGHVIVSLGCDSDDVWCSHVWELLFDFNALTLDEEVVGVSGAFGYVGCFFVLSLFFAGFGLLGNRCIFFLIVEWGLFEC